MRDFIKSALRISFSLGFFVLYVVGIPSENVGLHNITMFVVWAFLILSAIAIFFAHDEVIERYRDTSMGYRVLMVPIMFATDMVLIYNGMFVLGGACFIMSLLTMDAMFSKEGK